MPNWTRTDYVFYAREECIIKDFHDKLCQWLNGPSLCPEAWDGSSAWLGNILVKVFYSRRHIHAVEPGFFCFSCLVKE